MGILYEVTNFTGWGIWLFVLFALMAFNEFGRSTKWGGFVLFLIVPLGLSIFVWPTTADRIAPVATTHNPTAFFVVSLLSLIVNVILVAYQFNKIRKNKLNPLKDEIYVGTKAYKQVIEQNI